jgi:hypothetical protein
MRAASFLAPLTLALVAAISAGACTVKEPQPSTYFDVSIEPILQGSCVHSNTGAGCHVADAKGNAFGNLDLSSFTGIDHRRDLLLDYGPYQNPSLLVKNIAPYELDLQLWDGTKVVVTTDIKHTGGPILDPTASGFVTLKRWIENGATVNNTGVPPVNISRQPASDFVPTAPGFDPDHDPLTPDFRLFTQVANPILSKTCAAGNCHGTMTNALYLTRGTSPQEIRWNYFAAVDYLAATPPESELLRRPLATSQGGSYHEGGPLFESVNDLDYQALVQWATKHGPLKTPALDPAFMFFAQKVQPILVKKGCMMAQCHSAAMFHDFRLRGGSAGSFSLTATRKNYAFALAQMSLESDDVNASRLVRKNLYRSDQFADSSGIFHRGAPLFEDFGDNHAMSAGPICDQASYDYQNGNVDKIPAYCVIREWHRQERMKASAGVTAIVYVSRPPPPGPDRPQDFDVFAGGASLHIVPASLTATGDLTLSGADVTVNLNLGSCQLGSGPDIRRPAVSWDAKTIAFAARATPGDPLAIYTVSADGTGCAKQADIANHAATVNDLLEHDFDPAFSPPVNGVESIVFASTRGNLEADGATFDYSGPQRTPADPTKPNANLYVLETDPAASGKTRIRQLTWQLNMERLPSFMQDGRLIFTAEKRAPGFYQLALRRQNLDGGDYHPLYAQRGTIGYEQATNVVELADKNFATIFSGPTAVHGAGVVGIFNRSIGVDFHSQTASDYVVDPSVINGSAKAAPESDFFKHSLTVLPADGSYTSPSPLPDGKMLVSYGMGAPANFGGDYDLYVLDPNSGAKTKLLGAAGTAEVEAVAVYPRTDKGVFTSTPDEPNGHTSMATNLDPTRSAPADVTVLDMTLLASLLFQNTPTGRLIEPDLPSFQIYEDLPPDVTSFAAGGPYIATDAYGKVYVRRRLLGSVPLLPDGSAHFRIPGGLPIVLRLADDSESRQFKLPRWQREEMTFLPGETAHQALSVGFFDNVCAGCHGAVSGRPLDAALKPDFLTQASAVDAVGLPPNDYSGPPSKRGPPVGPPSLP